MYTVAKAPSSRIASKASRRGPAQQQIRTLDSFDTGRERFGSNEMSSPKPVFNGKRHFNRSNSGGNPTPNGMSNSTMTHEDTSYHQQHEENVRYIAEAWQKVSYDFDKKNGREDGPEFYREKFPHHFQGFEPIDLDQWVFRRMNGKS